MNQDLLSIGEFAAMTGLSPKMLRSYAASGVLVPAAVDALTGYRYYSRAQVAEARTVGLLRGGADTGRRHRRVPARPHRTATGRVADGAR